MNNIGTLRQTKGTIGSIVSYISAMSGCAVTYTYDATNVTAPHTFNVFAQRVNFISDPRFVDSTITAIHKTSMSGLGGGTYDGSWFTTLTWSVLAYGVGSTGASNPAVVNTTDGITISMPAGSYQPRTVMVYPQRGFPYYDAQEYGTSYDYTASAGASFSNINLALTSQKEAWEPLFITGSLPSSFFMEIGRAHV